MFYKSEKEFDAGRGRDGKSISEMFAGLSEANRTLALGRGSDFNQAHHLYMYNGKVKLTVYKHDYRLDHGKLVRDKVLVVISKSDFSNVKSLEEVLPPGGIFPESVDKEFMEKVLYPNNAGRFLAFDSDRAKKVENRHYHGYVEFV